MPEIHKRARSLDIWKDVQSLSSATLLEGDLGNKSMPSPKTNQKSSFDIPDQEEKIRLLSEENDALRQENAVLELNSITTKMKIRPYSWPKNGPNGYAGLDLVVPIPCRMGESSLQAENRMLKEEIKRLQYVSRIWDRYTAELNLLQRENEILRDQSRLTLHDRL